MPPHMFESECEAVSMGQLFNSLLSSSINTLSPLCNDSVGPRVYSPTYPMNNESSSSAAAPTQAKPAVDASSRRPPLTPVKPKKSFRNRKKVGLSLVVPPPPADRHQVPQADGDDAPPLISCSKNVELRRKSLSERHFFRPVSEDDESLMGKKP